MPHENGNYQSAEPIETAPQIHSPNREKLPRHPQTHQLGRLQILTVAAALLHGSRNLQYCTKFNSIVKCNLSHEALVCRTIFCPRNTLATNPFEESPSNHVRPQVSFVPDARNHSMGNRHSKILPIYLQRRISYRDIVSLKH